MIEASGSSLAAVYGLGGLLLAAVGLAGIGIWLWSKVGRTGVGQNSAVSTWTTVSGLLAFAAALATLFVEGMRHYGGSTTVAAGERVATCSTWWDEVSASSKAGGVPGDYSNTCRHDAIAAIWPGSLTAVLIGLAVGVVIFALMVGAARRRARRGPRVKREVGRIVE